MVNFTSFPIIETKRLILIRMSYDHIKDLYKMRSDPAMNLYVDVKPDETTSDTKCYIDMMNKGVDENKWIIWAVEYRKTKSIIGTISIWNIDNKNEKGELGYGIIPEYQRKGLMQEALLSILKYGFNIMNLKKLEAYTEKDNVHSIKLLESCNFVLTKQVDEQGYIRNKMFHMLVYAKAKR